MAAFFPRDFLSWSLDWQKVTLFLLENWFPCYEEMILDAPEDGLTVPSLIL